jgi:type II secretory pathway predicted ATPase ExeA
MLYLPYYSLNEKPFRNSADPKYFWLGEKQSEVVAVLNYGIENGNGITLLTGDVGSGKTALAAFIAGIHNKTFKIAKVDDADMESLDFLYVLADSLNLSRSFEDTGSFLRHIDEEYSKTQKRMLIILDEAHRATKSVLNDLGLMANIKRDKKHLVNIVLVGLNSLIELIKEPPIKGTQQNAPTLGHLRSLTIKETNEYIIHRLKVAGTQRKLFSSGAIGNIFRYSGGIPRVINTICDHALMIGYSTDLKEIKSSVIKECAQDLLIENSGLDNGKN